MTPLGGVCVCVWNIWTDVKLLPSFLSNLQGDAAFHWDCVQRSYQWNGISSMASWTYMQFFSVHGTRPSEEPHHHIFFRLRVRLSQSELTMVLLYWFGLQFHFRIQRWTMNGQHRNWSTFHLSLFPSRNFRWILRKGLPFFLVLFGFACMGFGSQLIRW